jgi:hypothetical protein
LPTNLYIKTFLYVDERRISKIHQTPPIRKMDDLIEIVIEFDEQLNLLPYTSFIAFSLYSCDRADEKPIASTTLPLYNENLEMRQGQYSLFLWPESYPDMRFETFTPGLLANETFSNINADLKKLMKIKRNRDDPLKKNNDTLNNGQLQLESKDHFIYKSIPFAFLIVDLPDCQGKPNSEQYLNKTVYYGLLPKRIPTSTFENKLATIQNASRLFESEDTANFFIPPDYDNPNLIVRDFDHDFQREDTVLNMYFMATKDEGDPKTLKPPTQDFRKIQEVLKKPNFTTLDPQEKRLMWRYRYYLRDQFSDALPKVLKADYLQVQDAAEVKDFIALMWEWKKIDYDDAIYLLSGDFALNPFNPSSVSYKPTSDEINTAIRQYAVDILKEISRENVEFIFLQLISALRYERLNSPAESTLLQFLLDFSLKSPQMSNLFYWHTCVECESKIPEIKAWYETIKNLFLTKLKEISPELSQNLVYQEFFRKTVQDLSKDIVSKIKAPGQRTGELRKRLADKSLQTKLEGGKENGEANMFILNPNKVVQHIIPGSCKIFSSNTAPTLLSYQGRIG